MSFIYSLRAKAWQWFAPAALLLLYPALAMLIHGAASALAILSSLIALFVVKHMRTNVKAWDCSDKYLLAALGVPLLVVVVVETWLGHFNYKALDLPLRFLIAMPLFFVLRRCPKWVLAWADFSFALGATCTLMIVLFISKNWATEPLGGARLTSQFMDPIHFGDVALLFGLLSVLSIDWWGKDSIGVRSFKVLGCLSGCFAFVASGTRGGWVAIPVVLALILFLPSNHRHNSLLRRWRFLILGLAATGICVYLLAVGLHDVDVHGRWGALFSDFQAFQQGDKDTSLGIRIQLYQAGFELFKQHPLLGLGDGGFGNAMQAFADSGFLTQVAATYGKGEAHNQLLIYLVNYGIFGGLAMLGIFVAPCRLFWGAARSEHTVVRRAGLMGLVFAIAFLLFGMSEEILNLKSTVSIYMMGLTTLLAIASATQLNGNADLMKPKV